MSFQEGNNIQLPAKVWTKISDTSMIFQIKGKWSTTIYYIETTEDLANLSNPTYLRIKTPNPLEHEIGYIQTGIDPEISDFRNYTYTANSGPLWLWSEEIITILKGI